MTALARTILWILAFGGLCVAAGSSAQWWEKNVRLVGAEDLEPQRFFSLEVSPTTPPSLPAQKRVTVTYCERSTGSLLADIHVPTRIQCPLAGWPVIISFHSGGWRNGHRGHAPIAELVDRGFAVVSHDFRSSDVAIFPAQLEDSIALLKWLKEHAGEHQLDHQRIALFGASSGGHLALLTGLCPEVSSQVQAVCSLYAPTDFQSLESGAGSQDEMNHFALWAPESLLLGGPIPEHPAEAQSASPLWQAAQIKKSPPILLMHGVDDDQIPFEQSLSLSRLLQEKHQPVTLWKIRSLPHGTWPTSRIQSGVFKFFSKHLGVTTKLDQQPQIARYRAIINEPSLPYVPIR